MVRAVPIQTEYWDCRSWPQREALVLQNQNLGLNSLTPVTSASDTPSLLLLTLLTPLSQDPEERMAKNSPYTTKGESA
jgi:hypothetical protein